ncbi:MAG: Gfo/Idh/MocA family oxidoreductase, partial [Phenylobacterium sp.]
SPGELRYRPELGGGALMDLGTYCLHWCRTVAGAEPKVTRADCLLGETGVDIWTRATLTFPSGVVADICCDMTAVFKAELTIEGAKGTLKVINPLAPQLGHRIEVEGGTPRRETVTRDPTYDFQLRAFVDAVRGGPAPPTAGADSIAQMRLLDAVARASRAKA